MKKQKGFTLIELLLVMAITGILAGTILVGVSGQREKARASSALESLNSILPYAVECYLRGTGPVAPSAITGGNAVCTGAPVYPTLSGGCNYRTNLNGSIIQATCAGGYTINCEYAGAGNCVLN